MSAKTAFHSLVHLFFPHTCAGCGSDVLDQEQLICLHCIDRLPLTGFYKHADNPVEKIFRGRLRIEEATSHLYFTKDSILQNLLHQFKYKGRKDIGLYFGQRMGEGLLHSGRFKKIDAIVPLPLFARREKKRGYNQAMLLCEGIAAVAGLPVLKNSIIRASETATQTHKSRIDRWQNMQGRFQLQPGALTAGKHVLLVDDVVTTGATLEACGRELLQAGIQLSIATLAFTNT